VAEDKVDLTLEDGVSTFHPITSSLVLALYDSLRELWHRLNIPNMKILECSNQGKCKLDNTLNPSRFAEVWETLDDLVIRWGLK